MTRLMLLKMGGTYVYTTAALYRCRRSLSVKVLAVCYILSFVLNFSLADARGRQRADTSTIEADDNLHHPWKSISLSSGRPGDDPVQRDLTGRPEGKPRLLGENLPSHTHSHSPTFSTIEANSELIQRRLLLQLGAPAPALTPNVTGFVCGICGELYIAGIGDTLLSIAKYCNVSLDLLQELNPDLGASVSIIDKDVTIPCTGTSLGNCTKCGQSVIISTGDTLDQISTRCGLKLQDLEESNPNIDYSNIFPEQYISLPCSHGKVMQTIVGCGVCGRSFTAEKDGIIDEVAEFCDVQLQELLEANPAVNGRSGPILQGQILRVPCSGNSSANCGPCGKNYTVTIMDSLMVIAAKCRVGFISLTAANPGVNLQKLSPGMHVTIPCDSIRTEFCSSCSPSIPIHELKLDISSIAKKCNVSTELIAYANNLPTSGIVPAPSSLSIPCASLPQRNLRQCGTCGSLLTLKSQVSLKAVAGACGTNISALRAENGNFTFELLGPKDQIALPCNMPQIGCGPCGIGYVTRGNETLESVAVRCATPADQIMQLNPQINFDQSMEDQTPLHVPCGTGSPSSAGQLLQPLQHFSQLFFFCTLSTILNLILISFL